jgi:amino acid transporter
MTSNAVSGDHRGLRRDLGLADLVWFNIAIVLGVPSIAMSAHIGPVAILLHLLAAFCFFVPFVNVVASLSRRFAGEGGFYAWIREAFGLFPAFLCGWSWWLGVMFFLPVMLLTGAAATLRVFVDNTAAEQYSRIELAVCVGAVWAVTAVNWYGFRFSRWLNDSGSALMYAAGIIVLIACGMSVLKQGFVTSFDASALSLDVGTLGLWAQIAMCYGGLEMGSILAKEVRDPARTLPRAAWVSAAACAGAYMFGSLSLMAVLRPSDIDPVSGLVQAASVAGTAIGAPWLAYTAMTLLVAGTIGRLSAHVGALARMPMLMAFDSALSPRFAELHPRWRTPYLILMVQACVCSVLLALARSGETLRNAWQLLMDMSILTLFFPFICMFAAAWKFGQRLCAFAGIAVSLLSMGFALVPPSGHVSVVLFELKLIGGTILLMSIGLIAYRKQRTGSELIEGRAGSTSAP